jgi:hypothetical protein
MENNCNLGFNDKLSDPDKMTFGEINEERIAIGYLPLKRFKVSHAGYIPQLEVERDPDSYIEPECIPACQELWAKNIYTRATPDPTQQADGMWIEIDLRALSTANIRIMLGLVAKGITLCSKHEGCVAFCSQYIGEDAQDQLLKIAGEFVLQDVMEDLAYKEVDAQYVPTKEEYVDHGRAYHSVLDYLKHRNYVENIRFSRTA